MNLHNVVGPIVAAVNPWVQATILQSNGSVQNADFSRTPLYLDPQPIQIQMQAMTWQDLAQVSGLNIQGEKRAMYLNGNWEGSLRADGRGGDMITLPDNSQWLIVQVLENWSSTAGWTKVAAVKQNVTSP